eukprot:1107122-Rhodomonas_salina.1
MKLAGGRRRQRPLTVGSDDGTRCQRTHARGPRCTVSPDAERGAGAGSQRRADLRPRVRQQTRLRAWSAPPAAFALRMQCVLLTLQSAVPGSVREVLVSGGFAEITDALAEGRVRVNEGAPSLQVSAPAANSSLDVRLGQRVTEVEHGPSGVTLQIAGAEPVQADYAIVSVPLGVLQVRVIRCSIPLF